MAVPPDYSAPFAIQATTNAYDIFHINITDKYELPAFDIASFKEVIDEYNIMICTSIEIFQFMLNNLEVSPRNDFSKIRILVNAQYSESFVPPPYKESIYDITDVDTISDIGSKSSYHPKDIHTGDKDIIEEQFINNPPEVDDNPVIRSSNTKPEGVISFKMKKIAPLKGNVFDSEYDINEDESSEVCIPLSGESMPKDVIDKFNVGITDSSKNKDKSVKDNTVTVNNAILRSRMITATKPLLDLK